MMGLKWGALKARTGVLAVLLVALCTALAVAGCGSSSDSSSSTAEATGGSGESGGSSFDAKLEAAQEGPTKWEGPTAAVKPPKTFNLALVTCDNASEGCSAPAKGAEEAAKKLGWKVTTYDGESDPTVQAKRVAQAITNNADGIITESVDGRGIGSALAEAKAAGIPVISTSNAAAPGEQGYKVDISPDFEQLGKDIADWVISDSGESAVLDTYVDREYQSTISTSEGILDEMKECGGCTANAPINFVAADLANKLGPETVSELRSNPDVNYVHFAYDPAATFQVPAILQAGLGEKGQGLEHHRRRTEPRIHRRRTGPGRRRGLGQQVPGLRLGRPADPPRQRRSAGRHRRRAGALQIQRGAAVGAADQGQPAARRQALRSPVRLHGRIRKALGPRVAADGSVP